MSPTSRLLVIEVVMVPAISQSGSPPSPAQVCSGSPQSALIIFNPQQEKPEDAPWPLLKNYGKGNLFAQHQSMELLNIVNGLSRWA